MFYHILKNRRQICPHILLKKYPVFLLHMANLELEKFQMLEDIQATLLGSHHFLAEYDL